MNQVLAPVQTDDDVRSVAGEVVDECKDGRARHARAMLALDEASARAKIRTGKVYDDVRILARALAECVEIRNYKKRQEFVLAVFEKISPRTGS